MKLQAQLSDQTAWMRQQSSKQAFLTSNRWLFKLLHSIQFPELAKQFFFLVERYLNSNNNKKKVILQL